MSVSTRLATYANCAAVRPCVFVLCHADYMEVYAEDEGAPYVAGVACVPGDALLRESYSITSHFGELEIQVLP